MDHLFHPVLDYIILAFGNQQLHQDPHDLVFEFWYAFGCIGKMVPDAAVIMSGLMPHPSKSKEEHLLADIINKLRRACLRMDLTYFVDMFRKLNFMGRMSAKLFTEDEEIMNRLGFAHCCHVWGHKLAGLPQLWSR